VYRREAFEAGLRAAGYELRQIPHGAEQRGNVMVGWARYGAQAVLADRFEAAGGTYLCAENAYIWTGGVSPHHLKARPAYALARGYHNDASVVPEGSGERWDALGVTLAPWRADGGHVLVCPNRPFGAPGRAMPDGWPQDVAARLRKLTKREIRIRQHPGNAAPHKPLADDLAGAWACVIWSSSAGVHALVAGVPVFQCAPNWICTSPASLNLNMIEDPAMDDYRRESGLRRLAWGQWCITEIEDGTAFRHLLLRENQSEVAAVA